jgi:hypothetical protein
MVRAKFKCWDVKSSEGVVQVMFMAVTDESEENKQFWQYTPSGQLTMSITNPAAYEQFKAGAEYYLDFTEVEKE